MTPQQPSILEYWPVILFGFTTFVSSIAVAIGLTMWIMGRLAEQDARRIELKEAILVEIRLQAKETNNQMREDRHTLRSRIEQQYAILDEKIDELATRLTRVEAHMENAQQPG